MSENPPSRIPLTYTIHEFLKDTGDKTNYTIQIEPKDGKYMQKAAGPKRPPEQGFSTDGRFQSRDPFLRSVNVA